ncbi:MULTISPECIES: zinc-ribbon domain-containing protein [Acinetobacter]|uniref:Zinc ribbon domain-containing protein n=1 Tax=Acinetobacter ursingii TaxID=108980 RepID=A0AA46NVP8_9GAMM|nr:MULTISPECIES: zinc ribbon domain-containing protein [Acinetobacter]UYF70516.1 zinc ribbon domain-containing protein [Acinetobacter ursingii]
MYCNQCGQPNSNDAKFCSGCGVRLLNTPTQSELPQQNTKLSPLRHLWLMFLFVISVIMIIGVFPYQVITGNFEFTYVFALCLWFWVLSYTYPQIFPKKLKTKSHQAFNALDEAELWLNKQDVKTSSVYFNAYDDPYLLKNMGATLLVGVGENSKAEHVGFAVEVKQGCGVLSSLIIEPSGIASQDKKAAHIARMNGKYMIDVLNQMAIQHRIKYPQ